jgi:hypothetical protein
VQGERGEAEHYETELVDSEMGASVTAKLRKKRSD